MFVIDRVAGYCFNYFVQHTKGGYVGHHQFIANECKADILVFGSSRAVHHYNTKMISDSLGVNAYNCGQDGNGVILSYGEWQMIKKRYQPKLIIYDVNPHYDLLGDEDNHKFLGWLKLYYDRDGISSVFDAIDQKEKIKMWSCLYRYNYNPIQLAADFVYPIYKLDEYGFAPIKGEMDTMRVRKTDATSVITDHNFDSLKINYLKKLVKERGNTKIIFCVSPVWYGLDSRQLQPIMDICMHSDIPFYDFSNSSKYFHNDSLFKDGTHLNERGADEFTDDLLKLIRGL